MKEISIKARSDGRIYHAEKGNLQLAPGDQVLFESDQCQEVAEVTSKEQESAKTDNQAEAEAVVIRRLSSKDKEEDAQKKAEARSTLVRCKEIVVKHSLPMEVLDADLSFDGKKLTFYFSAPGRVDFRSLVSELASAFQKLIRLQQVGVRDRARHCGGIGRCGLDFCCKKFLNGELECVTLDMAYDQNLGQMGSNRVTGACGKLMCCLKYELDVYKDGKAKLPPVGSELKSEKGKGRVVAQSILKNQVTIELADKTYVEVDC